MLLYDWVKSINKQFIEDTTGDELGVALSRAPTTDEERTWLVLSTRFDPQTITLF